MSFQKEHIMGLFYRYNIRNISMVVKQISETRFDINYSKLVGLLYEEKCQRKKEPINKNTKKHIFQKYIITEKFMNHVIYFMETHNITHNLNDDDKFTSVPDLCERTNGLFYQEINVINKATGTYGPYEFVDIILVQFDPKYASMVHKIMDQIDRNAAIKNQTFEEEYNETLFKLEQMEDKFEDYNVDISELKELRQLKEDIEKHEYEFNPNINLILSNRIDTLQTLQRDLRIYTAYAYYILKRNFTHIEKCKKPTFKEMIEIINPTISESDLDNLTDNELRKKMTTLASTNDERFFKLITNEIIELFGTE